MIYNKKTHFNKIINQYQGKLETDTKIYEQLKTHFQNNGIVDITPNKILNALKVLNLKNYYEHVNTFYFMFTGIRNHISYIEKRY